MKKVNMFLFFLSRRVTPKIQILFRDESPSVFSNRQSIHRDSSRDNPDWLYDDESLPKPQATTISNLRQETRRGRKKCKPISGQDMALCAGRRLVGTHFAISSFNNTTSLWVISTCFYCHFHWPYVGKSPSAIVCP
jgi:hypothetical protein